MRISELMHKDVETIDADECLRTAAERMRAHSLGALPVTENGELVGMLTDRDIAVRSTALGKDPNVTPVREAMTPTVITCSEDDTLDAGELLMEEKSVRRLVVVDDEHHAVGILSMDDVATVPGKLLRPGELLEHLSLYS
ncbi:CBS domain-containing protein [Corallococcus llansteffanensis]|uniref:CBS domain-containing protein n=1 Tax=Corallococcus llansteffanensis TaxID=2316731 RepID=A0A3A8QHG1_9BACT|nr:CBS domain-containing protein [Corallococcus llansteffanensis]RKH67121.1 CBS domain-containing protein [Corallococcus llansteffanensis]